MAHLYSGLLQRPSQQDVFVTIVANPFVERVGQRHVARQQDVEGPQALVGVSASLRGCELRFARLFVAPAQRNAFVRQFIGMHYAAADDGLSREHLQV